MLRDVTLGRYYPNDSPLHSLDPRTKLAEAVLYIVTVFLASSPLSCALTLAFLCLLMSLSRVPFRYVFRGLAPIVALVVAVCLINVFVSKSGPWKAIMITTRMVELVLVSNLVTLTTKPKALTAGLERAFCWLRLFKVPVHDLATAICIALRFLPILSEEAGQVIDAQRARGARIGKGGLVSRVRSLLPVLVPMFVSAFRKADELSVAMDSRLYGGGKVSLLKPLSYGRGDLAACLCSLAYLATVILMRVSGV